jgi:hypothetical protein
MLWAAFGGYVTLAVAVSRWLAGLLGLPAAAVALPLGVGPVLAAFRKQRLGSYYFVVPVALAVFLVLAVEGEHWLAKAFAAACTFGAGFVLHGLVVSMRYQAEAEDQDA